MPTHATPAPGASALAVEHVDVLIIGAGLSGIGAAWHLQHEQPGKSYAILEARAASGGTWDLFRYPGIRSDSDLATFAYAFRPWTGEQAIADGPDILRYREDVEHLRHGPVADAALRFTPRAAASTPEDERALTPT